MNKKILYIKTMLTPVSYTHLDVYKRQIITRRVITTILTAIRTVIGTTTPILITGIIIISPLTARIAREIPTPVMVKDITSQIEITITIIVIIIIIIECHARGLIL